MRIEQTSNSVGSRFRSKSKSKSDRARDIVRALGPIQPTDDAETKLRKLDAVFALSDALITEGMKTLSVDEINVEVAASRGGVNFDQ